MSPLEDTEEDTEEDGEAPDHAAVSSRSRRETNAEPSQQHTLYYFRVDFYHLQNLSGYKG